jgi:TRAP-type transport system small permease protein
MFRFFDRTIETITVVAMLVLMTLMTASVILGVFFRYVLNDPLVWSEEVARYSMVWVSVLGGGLAFRRGGHIAVTFVLDYFHGSLRRVIVIAGGIGIFFFLAIMFWYGWDMAERVARQRSAALRISMSYAYAAIPVGAALMMYHMLVAVFVKGEDAAASGKSSSV